MYRFLVTILLAITIAPAVSIVSAQVMESSSYKIQSDSINFGGAYSESASYRLEDTLGEIATGPSESASYELRAGYQQMHEVYLALVPPGDVTMAPSIGGVTGGESNGMTSATATTDSLAGYELSLKASSSPAMQGIANGDTIADYAPGAVPSYAFSVAVDESALAYSPEGDDVAARFLNDGTNTCGTGSLEDADACWDGLTTSDVAVARRTSSNHPSGTQTVLKFKVGVGAGRNQVADDYVATTTLTLVAL